MLIQDKTIKNEKNEKVVVFLETEYVHKEGKDYYYLSVGDPENYIPRTDTDSSMRLSMAELKAIKEMLNKMDTL